MSAEVVEVKSERIGDFWLCSHGHCEGMGDDQTTALLALAEVVAEEVAEWLKCWSQEAPGWMA